MWKHDSNAETRLVTHKHTQIISDLSSDGLQNLTENCLFFWELTTSSGGQAGKEKSKMFSTTAHRNCVGKDIKEDVSCLVPVFQQAVVRSCGVCGFHTPPCNQPGADAGPGSVPCPLSQRYTAALSQEQLLCQEDTATQTLADSPSTFCHSIQQTQTVLTKTERRVPTGRLSNLPTWGGLDVGSVSGQSELSKFKCFPNSELSFQPWITFCIGPSSPLPSGGKIPLQIWECLLAQCARSVCVNIAGVCVCVYVVYSYDTWKTIEVLVKVSSSEKSWNLWQEQRRFLCYISASLWVEFT